MVTSSSTALAAVWKWLQGWQEHERRVADKMEDPVKPAVPSPEVVMRMIEAAHSHPRN